jgi:hypothetical protein
MGHRTASRCPERYVWLPQIGDTCATSQIMRTTFDCASTAFVTKPSCVVERFRCCTKDSSSRRGPRHQIFRGMLCRIANLLEQRQNTRRSLWVSMHCIVCPQRLTATLHKGGVGQESAIFTELSRFEPFHVKDGQTDARQRRTKAEGAAQQRDHPPYVETFDVSALFPKGKLGKFFQPLTQTPLMFPLVLRHLDPMPHSKLKEQVLPYVLFRSSGAVTGCLSFRFPGVIPPAQMPYIEPDFFKHLLPIPQSRLNEQASAVPDKGRLANSIMMTNSINFTAPHQYHPLLSIIASSPCLESSVTPDSQLRHAPSCFHYVLQYALMAILDDETVMDGQGRDAAIQQLHHGVFGHAGVSVL